MGGSRCSKPRVALNTIVIFLVSGFWHGANWTFIAWGAFHALLFLPLILTGNNRKYKEVVAPDHILPSFKEFWQILLTFFLVTIGWVIFRADNLSQAWSFFTGVFHWKSIGDLSLFFKGDFLIRAVWIAVMLFVEWIDRGEDHGLSMRRVRSRVVRYAFYFAIILVTMLYFDDGSPKFIYFQF